MRTTSYVRCCMFALILTALVLGIPATSGAQVSIGVTVGFPPPDLPVYEQPLCPGDGYIWTPGYWAWDPDFGDYYWVPGTWVLAPEVGFFWTPSYWAWGDRGFVFYEGYWAPVVGFYGGVNYGYGYFGHGYQGGRWQGGHFFYNQTVNNVNVTVVRNVYKTTINQRNVTRVSYNGGSGGINDRATPEEERAAHERHVAPVSDQKKHVQAARSDPELRASANQGKPRVAATPKPAALKEHGVVSAREGGKVHGGPKNAPGGGGNAGDAKAAHPNELPPVERSGPANSGNAKTDQKYQKQEEKLNAQQDKDRQKLEKHQEKEHQQLEKQHGDEGRKQQMEQRHQQETQKLEQKQTEQRQRLEGKPEGKQPEGKQSHGEPPKR